TRSMAHHPLFQVVLAMQKASRPSIQLPGLTVRVERAWADTARFDIFFSLQERQSPEGTPSGLAGAVEYATDLFDADTINSLLERWQRLLRHAVSAPDRPVGEADLLSHDEGERLTRWSGLGRDDAGGVSASLGEVWRERVVESPESVALVGEGREWTF